MIITFRVMGAHWVSLSPLERERGDITKSILYRPRVSVCRRVSLFIKLLKIMEYYKNLTVDGYTVGGQINSSIILRNFSTFFGIERVEFIDNAFFWRGIWSIFKCIVFFQNLRNLNFFGEISGIFEECAFD